MAASLDAGPCLIDILSHHGLEKKDLERQCPPRTRISIAAKLVDWKTTGYYFGVPAEKIAAIDRENSTEDQRRIALLDCWEKREGRNASCLKLADVLHRRERRDLVEQLCAEIKTSLAISKKESALSDGKQLQPFTSSIDIVKRIDTLQKQFGDLHRRFIAEMKEQRVSVDDIVAELTLLPIECRKEYESSIQQMLPTLEESARITTLFNRLNPLLTFIDYGLLHHLISNLGSTELKEDMTSYVDVVQEFMRETTVGDVMDHWPGDEEPYVNYSKLMVKLKDDPKTYTLEQLNKFRRRFCSKVRLSEFIFGLISLEPSESFFVTWFIPTVVVPELKKSVCQIDQSFYESEHILSISVDKEQVYPLSIASPLPELVQSPKPKQPEVSLAGDLITPTLTPKSTVEKKDVQPKLSDSTVNIIVVGWEGASRYAEGIVGQNRDNSLKLWDCSNKVYRARGVDNCLTWWGYSDDKYDNWNGTQSDMEEFCKKKQEELQTRIQKCPTPNLVLFFNRQINLFTMLAQSFQHKLIVGFTVSDLVKLFGHSIWNNTVIVQPCELDGDLPQHQQSLRYQMYLKEENIKPKFIWRDIDPEVVSNIPAVPINIHSPELPDHIGWLSPFWDTCLLRMKDTAQHTFLRANADRIKLAATGQKREDNHKPLHEKTIFYAPGPNTSEAPIRSAVSNLLGTEVAGPLDTPIEQHYQDLDQATQLQDALKHHSLARKDHKCTLS